MESQGFVTHDWSMLCKALDCADDLMIGRENLSDDEIKTSDSVGVLLIKHRPTLSISEDATAGERYEVVAQPGQHRLRTTLHKVDEKRPPSSRKVVAGKAQEDYRDER